MVGILNSVLFCFFTVSVAVYCYFKCKLKKKNLCYMKYLGCLFLSFLVLFFHLGVRDYFSKLKSVKL